MNYIRLPDNIGYIITIMGTAWNTKCINLKIKENKRKGKKNYVAQQRVFLPNQRMLSEFFILFIYLFTYLSIYLSIYLFIYLCIYLFIYLFIFNFRTLLVVKKFRSLKPNWELSNISSTGSYVKMLGFLVYATGLGCSKPD